MVVLVLILPPLATSQSDFLNVISKPILMCFLLFSDISVEKTRKHFLLPSGKTQEPTFECPAFSETQKAHRYQGHLTQRDLSGNSSISPRWRGPPACGHLLSVAIILSPYLNNAISVLFTFTRVPLFSSSFLCSSSIFKFSGGFELTFSFQSTSLSVSTSTGKNTFSLFGLPLNKTDFRFLNILGIILKGEGVSKTLTGQLHSGVHRVHRVPCTPCPPCTHCRLLLQRN